MTEIPAVFALFALVILLFLVCVSIGAFIAVIWFMFYLLIRFLLKPIWKLITGQIYVR
jgi:hypothetical protein